MFDIEALSKRRYTAKAYAPNTKIPQAQFEQLMTLLQNSPSSVNSQPWHFVVAQTAEGKNRLLEGIVEFNHARVENASHVVVFCVRKTLDAAHFANVLAQEDKDGRFANEEMKATQDKGRLYFANMNNKTPQDWLAWESKQAYLALGALLFGAAALGIDATPIEGFDPAKLDAALGLHEKGLTSVVVASLGYHSENDFNARLPKSRLPKVQLFTFI